MRSENEAHIRHMVDIALESGCAERLLGGTCPTSRFYRLVAQMQYLGVLQVEKMHTKYNSRTWLLKVDEELLQHADSDMLDVPPRSVSQKHAMTISGSASQVRELCALIMSLQEDVQRLERTVDMRLITLETRVVNDLGSLKAITCMLPEAMKEHIAHVVHPSALGHSVDGSVSTGQANVYGGQIYFPALEFLLSLLDSGEVYVSGSTFGKKFLKHFVADMNGKSFTSLSNGPAEPVQDATDKEELDFRSPRPQNLTESI